MEKWNEYINALKSVPVNELTEHSRRTDLENLLKSIAKEQNPKNKILHEPTAKGKYGRPDFEISLAGSIIGYVENKKVDEDLDKTLKSPQLKKYQELSDNILLTNYIEWIWIKDGKVLDRQTLCYRSDLEYQKFKLNTEKTNATETLIKNFLSQPPKRISDAKKLAGALAVRAKMLKEFLNEELQRQHKDNREGKLYQLYETFRQFVFNELALDEFADAFAQNLVYGLFLAKLNADTQEVTLYNARKFIPISFELIRELVDFLDELDNPEYHPTRWIVEEVLTILNNLDLREIQRTLHYTSSKKKDLWDETDFNFRDPFIYFYELFLAVYDKKLRKSRGVYYTPPQVVNFIVRAVNDILKDTFEIEDGLADPHKVTVLDFATGTGTFLLEVLQQIFEQLPKGSAKKDIIVREHILRNIFGFEYLIAPYTIAHLKLSQFLKDNGYTMTDSERLQVFLTNTLEPGILQTKIPFLPALSEEIKRAKHVKEQPILVITGNPPYSGNSKNPSDRIVSLNKGDRYNKGYSWDKGADKLKVTQATASKDGTYKIKTAIGEKIMDYFFVDGAGLKEKNPKWLQDDYVKFIRFAQDKMDKVDEGIVAIITNHRFLTNPTFRGMRQSLMKTFDRMYFLDLHGSNKPKETAPDGSNDVNVFDIEQGVAISILIKKKGLEKNIYHADVWGKREEKYKICINNAIETIKWTKVKSKRPFYLFIPQDSTAKKKYEYGYSVNEIFIKNALGIFTHRDPFLVDFDAENLAKRIDRFRTAVDSRQVNEWFGLKDTRDWKIENAINSLKEEPTIIRKYIYRPFDRRNVCYNLGMYDRGCTRYELMKTFLEGDCPALITGRAGQNVNAHYLWNLVTITDDLSDANLFYRGGAMVYPLYISKSETANSKQKDLISEPNETERSENFTPEFREYINGLYGEPAPEQVLGYIYAILHSPAYREKYAEFLKIDFPRVPFTEDKKLFAELSSLGTALIDAHLMRSSLKGYKKPDFLGNGDGVVSDVSYHEDARKLYINKGQYFENVPAEAWTFHIGGYQVLAKYLKDRKGRKLIGSEIENIENVVRILSFSTDQMQKIDSLTRSWI